MFFREAEQMSIYKKHPLQWSTDTGFWVCRKMNLLSKLYFAAPSTNQDQLFYFASLVNPWACDSAFAYIMHNPIVLQAGSLTAPNLRQHCIVCRCNGCCHSQVSQSICRQSRLAHRSCAGLWWQNWERLVSLYLSSHQQTLKLGGARLLFWSLTPWRRVL